VQTAPIDVDIEGTALRIVVDDPDGAQALRQALEHRLIDREAPLGFRLKSPRTGRGLVVLSDRCGVVLARTRSVSDGLAVLSSHLAAFLRPLDGTVRLRVRVLTSATSGTALLLFPLGVLTPLVERRLDGAGWRMLDRLVVDVDAATLRPRLRPIPWTGLGARAAVAGHADYIGDDNEPRLLIVPSFERSPLSRATVVHMLASHATASERRRVVLDTAERLAFELERRDVGIDDAGSLYGELRLSSRHD
jgi:hypothetical protein